MTEHVEGNDVAPDENATNRAIAEATANAHSHKLAHRIIPVSNGWICAGCNFSSSYRKKVDTSDTPAPQHRPQTF